MEGCNRLKKGNEYEIVLFFLVKTRILISYVVKLENWRADGFRWRQGESFKCLVPRPDHSIGTKKYFQSIKGKDKDGNDLFSNEFIRVTFHHQLPKDLIYYKGDENISSKLPHGNAKSAEMKERPLVPTIPSLLREMEEKCGGNP